MVSNLAKLTESLRGETFTRPARSHAFSETLAPEEVQRARAEFKTTGQTVVTDRNGNRFLVTRRGR